MKIYLKLPAGSGIPQAIAAMYDRSHILHHSQERALGPVPQKINFLVEQAGQPVHKRLIDNGATYEIVPSPI